MEVDTMDAILAQNKAIAQQLTNLNKKTEKLEVASMGTQGETSTACGLCGGSPIKIPNANTYNPGWRNHPNLGWGGNQNQRGSNFQNRPHYPPFQRPPFPQPTTIPPPPQPKLPQDNSFEAALEKFSLTTAVNPKGECKAIILRSGKIVQGSNHGDLDKQFDQSSQPEYSMKLMNQQGSNLHW
ncbi:hypothetical protein PIB30_040888 [Stylosanthes scabra]|uniref:Uncharacterized protein n=1 Tax=Stylosanthes scabra TaxID=79078 RepID=A0ABU6UHF3_9FABA|nr:hypothetical protein [Stylosanthes scabra]